VCARSPRAAALTAAPQVAFSRAGELLLALRAPAWLPPPRTPSGASPQRGAGGVPALARGAALDSFDLVAALSAARPLVKHQESPGPSVACGRARG